MYSARYRLAQADGDGPKAPMLYAQGRTGDYGCNIPCGAVCNFR